MDDDRDGDGRDGDDRRNPADEERRPAPGSGDLARLAVPPRPCDRRGARPRLPDPGISRGGDRIPRPPGPLGRRATLARPRAFGYASVPPAIGSFVVDVLLERW